MAFTCISKNKFQEDFYFHQLVETENYIVTVQAPTFGSASEKTDNQPANIIGVYDKKMQLIQLVPIHYSMIEKIMVKESSDVIAIACPKHYRLIIMELNTLHHKEIGLYKWPDFDEEEDDEDVRGLYPSQFYWWRSDFIFVKTVFNQIYRIDLVTNSASLIDEKELRKSCFQLHALLNAIDDCGQIIWLNPYAGQFIYFSGDSIGFIDIAKNIHHSALYFDKDIHFAYFYENTFIVVNCYTIELVTFNGIKTVYKPSLDSHDEFGRALFICDTQEFIVADGFWKGTLQYDSLLRFKFDGEVESFTQKEIDEYAIMAYLRDHPADIKAWLRLSLIELYNGGDLAFRWFDKIPSGCIYLDFIRAFQDVNGHIYNSLRLSTHEDSEIIASIKYAMSRYLKKRGDMRRYEQVLLRSIEYGPGHVKNRAALGEFYLGEGRMEEGKAHIERAIKNVRVIYTDKTRDEYDKYDIQEFLNEHYKGIHMTQALYDDLIVLIDNP
jgi:hypothetical protein